MNAISFHRLSSLIKISMVVDCFVSVYSLSSGTGTSLAVNGVIAANLILSVANAFINLEADTFGMFITQYFTNDPIDLNVNFVNILYL